jgi:hypothetical protein
MNFEDIKNKVLKLISSNHTDKTKIYATISLSWIMLIGYLTWWNGLKSIALDKSFKWDEWFWFGIVPALAPYLFQFIWKDKKKSSNTNHFKE